MFESEMDKSVDLWTGPVFFIVGCGRSGTTWVRNIFNEHPEVIVGEESYFFCDVTPHLKKIYSTRKGPTGLGKYVTQKELMQAVGVFFRRIAWYRARKKAGVKWFGEKTPAHIHRIDDIVGSLPDSRIIHLVRDARDVVASMLDAARSWANNPGLTARRAAEVWLNAAKAGIYAEQRTPNKVLRLRYEDLIRNGPGTIRKLFGFIDLQLNDEQIERIYENTSFEKYTNGRLPGDPGGNGQFYRLGIAGGWKQALSNKECSDVLNVAREMHSVLGYSDE